MNNSIKLVPWVSTSNYGQYAITQSYGQPAVISTVPNNVGINPSGISIWPTYGYSRSGEIATVYLTNTGISTQCFLARGSQVALTGMVDQLLNFTGMILGATNSNAFASQCTISFMNPGPDEGFVSSNLGTVQVMGLGAWTSGWLFSPGYAMNLGVDNNVNVAKYEPGYSQRQPLGLNSNTLTLGLSYEARQDIEIKAMLALEQTLGGVYSTTIMNGGIIWMNDPTLKFVLTTPKVSPKSYNNSDVTVIATQVYES